MEYRFERHRIDKIPRDRLVAELVRVARERDYVTFGKREFDELATVSSNSVMREFGSWVNAIDFLSLELEKLGITLRPKHRGYFTKTECFDELERVWKYLGHRPSKIEWESASPVISYKTYIRYFGGWTNACLSFLEVRGHGSLHIDPPASAGLASTARELQAPDNKPLPSRNIAAGLRLRVYERDRFRCVFCGRSPITSLEVQLHVDHVVPFSHGGKTTIENLQTLCSDCNLGKSSRTDVKRPDT